MPCAAIDIGSHTARLLIAEPSLNDARLKALMRKRTYIRLSEDVDQKKGSIIQPAAIDRTINALNDFLTDIQLSKIHLINAVATGVVRTALNRKAFLDQIQDQTGLLLKVISGKEEAALSAKGVLSELKIQSDTFCVFDLGGGTTEFYIQNVKNTLVRSIPLGAAVLTHSYLAVDPPEKGQLRLLSGYIDQKLKDSGLDLLRNSRALFIAGTGGTVTTLSLMQMDLSPESFNAEQVNGVVLKKSWLKALFDKMCLMGTDQRSQLPGLDINRSGIILAGCLTIIKILEYANAVQLTVCLSDLLEGILLNHFEGENHD